MWALIDSQYLGHLLIPGKHRERLRYGYSAQSISVLDLHPEKTGHGAKNFFTHGTGQSNFLLGEKDDADLSWRCFCAMDVASPC